MYRKNTLENRVGTSPSIAPNLALFVLRITQKVPKIPGRDWYQIEALILVFPTHLTDLRETGCANSKNVKEKGSKNGKKWTWKGRIGPMKKSKDTLLYQFFVPNPAAHSKISKTCQKSP